MATVRQKESVGWVGSIHVRSVVGRNKTQWCAGNNTSTPQVGGRADSFETGTEQGPLAILAQVPCLLSESFDSVNQLLSGILPDNKESLQSVSALLISLRWQ